MKTVRPVDLGRVIREGRLRAETSPRRRAHYCLHEEGAYLQRMVNICCEDTYVQPHRHDHIQLENFIILEGRGAVPIFGDDGRLIACPVLERGSECELVEIPPKTWHSFVPLSPFAAFLEITEGAYNPSTHKVLAPWAPLESETTKAREYAEFLRESISTFKQGGRT